MGCLTYRSGRHRHVGPRGNGWVGVQQQTGNVTSGTVGGGCVGVRLGVAGGQLSTDGTALAQSAHNNWGESGTGRHRATTKRAFEGTWVLGKGSTLHSQVGSRLWLLSMSAATAAQRAAMPAQQHTQHAVVHAVPWVPAAAVRPRWACDGNPRGVCCRRVGLLPPKAAGAHVPLPAVQGAGWVQLSQSVQPAPGSI